jgi:hypothetical protein
MRWHRNHTASAHDGAPSFPSQGAQPGEAALEGSAQRVRHNYGNFGSARTHLGSEQPPAPSAAIRPARRYARIRSQSAPAFREGRRNCIADWCASAERCGHRPRARSAPSSAGRQSRSLSDGEEWMRHTRYGLSAQEPKHGSLVQSDVVGPVALNLVLRLVLARVMHVAFVIHVLRVHFDDSAADPPGLRIPAHAVACLEPFGHA